MIISRIHSMALAAGFLLVAGWSPAADAQAAGRRLTPVAQRITDEAIASDLAVFSALHERASRLGAQATGTRKYLAARAVEYLVLAQAAYERNDRSAFPEDMIVLAERDLAVLESGGEIPSTSLSSVLFPDRVRVFDDETWGRAVALRRDADRVGAPEEIARAESALLRAGHPILAGPACLADSAASRAVGDRLRVVEATRVTPVPVVPAEPPQVVPDRPPPVPVPDSTRLPVLPRGRCDAPERLSGVVRTVHFALDRHELSAATRQVLDRTIAQLHDAPGVRIRLSGHTDPRASNPYNLALSERRVRAVHAYLIAGGIEVARILGVAAEGEERLLTTGTGVRDMARNRRVEVAYILCDGSELVPDETLDDLQIERVPRRRQE